MARTVRILHTLLGLVGKHRSCDKFEVNTQSVAYLAGKLKPTQPVMKSFVIKFRWKHLKWMFVFQLCSRSLRRWGAAAVWSTGSHCCFRKLLWRTFQWTHSLCSKRNLDAGENFSFHQTGFNFPVFYYSLAFPTTLYCFCFFNDFLVLLILTLSKVSGYCVKTSPGLLQKCQSAALHLHTLPWGRPAFAHANPWAWTWASRRKPMQRNYWVWVVCGFIL